MVSTAFHRSLGSRPPHHRGHEVPDARGADLSHRGAQLDAQQLEHALDAVRRARILSGA